LSTSTVRQVARWLPWHTKPCELASQFKVRSSKPSRFAPGAVLERALIRALSFGPCVAKKPQVGTLLQIRTILIYKLVDTLG